MPPFPRRFLLALSALSLLVGLACATPPLPVPARVASGFDPQADTFVYANQLRWEYGQPGSAHATRAASSEITGGSDRHFAHRCAIMVRAIRQFYYGARFDPSLPRASEEEYDSLVDGVLATDSRRETPLEDPVVIPGFRNLREFSIEYTELLRGKMGSSWRTWFQRGNWRMIFPFSREHQRRTAERLLASQANGHPTIVHILNFPRIDINHTMLLYGGESNLQEIRFFAYDPNDPGSDAVLLYDREQASFIMPPTIYFAGGTTDAYEVYDGLLY
jgi:hypothetical protein